MGRLNYTNRKAEGLKQGQIVNKDLVKRIPPNPGSKAAFRDPAVELDVSGKALTDEGFFEIASALVETLVYDGVQGRCARLEELCLKDNQLTIASLQAMTPIIQLACNDLRDLDLSANKITVDTKDEVAIWESFLNAFERCCTLRRIDWSGNALGPRAFEVLLRVYAKEGPIDLNLLPEFEQAQDEVRMPSTAHGVPGPKMRKMSIIPDSEEYIDEDGSPHPHSRRGSRQDSKPPEKANATTVQTDPQPLYTTTQGLRSVPYLVLCGTSMTETCALHLSYIVENHHTPQQLLNRVPPVKAGPSAQQLIFYENELHCHGIVYLPNARLSTTGMKVLELAERRRKIQFGDTNDAKSGPSTKPKELGKPSRRMSGTGPRPTIDARRRLFTHKGGLDHGEEGADLDRARSRIQGDTLQEAGPLSNELWRAALRMLVLGREIQLAKDDSLQPTSAIPAAPEAPKGKGPIVKTLTIPGYVKPQPLKSLTPVKPLTSLKPLPRLDPFPPLQPFTPLIMMEKDPNQPITPWNPNLRKKSESIPFHAHMVSLRKEPEFCNPAVEGKHPSRTDKVYRTQLPCGFSEDVWRRILGQFAGVNGILSADQQSKILRYAMDRRTLSKESEVLGLTFATQIWRILEATGCLTYELDV